MNCANPECGHPLRPKGTSLEDHPGTKKHGGYGLCSACYIRQWRKSGKTYTENTEDPRQYDPWGKCAHCKRPMRPHKAKAVDHPGTYTYGGYGHCGACRGRKLRTGTYEDAAPKPEPTFDPTAPHADTLMAYYRKRQERIARTKRINLIRAKYGAAA